MDEEGEAGREGASIECSQLNGFGHGDRVGKSQNWFAGLSYLMVVDASITSRTPN